MASHYQLAYGSKVMHNHQQFLDGINYNNPNLWRVAVFSTLEPGIRTPAEETPGQLDKTVYYQQSDRSVDKHVHEIPEKEQSEKPYNCSEILSKITKSISLLS